MPRMTEAELLAYQSRRAQRSGERAMTDEDDETPESKIQEQILNYCRARGWFIVRSRMDKPTTYALGTPDLIIFADRGEAFLLEVKRPGRKLRPEQAGTGIMLEMLGHRWAVVHSFAEFMEFIS